jgi:CBS domain-containing protein
MLVAQIMKRDVRACRPHDSLRCAADLMWAGHCGSLPVVNESEHVVAILTDRDLCMATCRGNLPPETTPVSAVAPGHVVTVREDECTETAECIMRDHHVRRVPVVDRAHRLVGIVSLHDLARHAYWAGSKGDGLTTESVVATEIAIGERPGFG